MLLAHALRSEAASATSIVIAMVIGLSTPGADAVARGSGINRDAMTMQDCKDRLALPRSRRQPSEDPAIDLDAVCANMLSANPHASKPASAASAAGRPASAARG